MAKTIPWVEDSAVTDWTRYASINGTQFQIVDSLTVSEWKNRTSDKYIRIITPTAPDFIGTFRLVDNLGTWGLAYGGVWVWFSERPGGPPINQFEQLLTESIGGRWQFQLTTNSNRYSNPGSFPWLDPSTTYYMCFQAAGVRNAPNGGAALNHATFFVEANGTYPAYAEVPPPPPPPPPPEPPPPEPPGEPPPPEPPPVEPPPPSTEGPNNPPGSSVIPPDFGTPSSPSETTSITDVAPPKPQAVANKVGAQAARVMTKDIVGQLGFGVPEPRADSESLFRTVEGLKIFQEQMTRQRGDRGKSAVLVEELPAFVNELVRELDKRYATNYVSVEIPTSDANQPLEITDIGGIAAAVTDHITNTAIHMTDAPATGVWGRVRGAWVRAVGFDDLTSTTISLEDQIATPGDSIIDTDRGGFISTFKVNQEVREGQVCNIAIDGRMGLADASTENGSSSLLGLALGSGFADANVEFLLNGYYNPTGPVLLTGQQLYLDPAVPGGMTGTVPSGSLNVVRVCGYATAATELYFNPDRTWIVLA